MWVPHATTLPYLGIEIPTASDPWEEYFNCQINNDLAIAIRTMS